MMISVVESSSFNVNFSLQKKGKKESVCVFDYFESHSIPTLIGKKTFLEGTPCSRVV